ncbi:aspartate/glutamate racemase family protein [Pediococcus argentinicus]|uniref:Aspartate racemase n=1 Tax=Pediococcus argentinicus TaxID=480391 RepID=A0A0R2NP72_9LACO|nr:amino acid racemase [Pediococcus argentinicus]KRO25651.1 aspartate racemase [Pediococcus argentinicus]NKZ22011.1 amino acid racemase [Pediococcus argentinicus]GEP19182.1 aspartate racemase [Pediococcus argentinicus]
MKDFFTIIGGMGTPATESYIRLLNKRTPAHKDQDYLNYILVNHATVPDRSTYLLDNSKPNPYPDLLEDIKAQSELHPAFFVIACNTAHYFYDDLQKATDVPIVHMPRETVKLIKKQYPEAKRVGIIGTPGTTSDGIYDRELEALDYEVVKPTPEIQDMTSKLIFDDIKANNQVDDKLFYSILNKMINEQKSDVVILGCTELSYAQEMAHEHNFPVMDSQLVLVDKSIEMAMKLRN